MDVLVTGAAGMLGTDLVTALLEADHEVTGLDRSDLDVTDAEAVATAVSGHDVVVNCAAWTAVDDAEAHEADALAVNATAAGTLARACAAAGVRLVHLSTDYAVGGHPAGTPVPADAPLSPVGAYGRTKAAGEEAVRASGADALVLRTAWLYGAHGSCFPRTMARLARERDVLRVVDDQLGQPTWTVDVADLVVRLLAAGAPAGTYHATSAGWTSWYELAMEVVRSVGRDPDMVEPIASEELDRPAPRPAWSVLAHDSLKAVGVAPIGPWRLRWAEAADEVLAGV
ncbi:dTDP-4-dehydrorhamnose reductase [Jannaschia sp. R86511]|uniref:dTDP-4-dehydrorhamnose reductase n=1 Tax=Jannaschia sp. R86511 TaxID=3093853 RepID=UPI0036D3DFB1